MLRQACFVLAIYCFSGNLAFSQNTTGQTRRGGNLSIHGRVMVPDNHNPDLRVEVRLERDTAQLISSTFTDAIGNFEFRNLSIGSYSVSISLPGYEAVRQSIDIFNAFSDNSITVFLARAVTVKERPTGLDAADPDIVDISQMRDNLPKKAVQDYEKAIEEKFKGRTENAIKLLEEAVRIAPNFFHAHNSLGVLYASMNRDVDAEAQFKRSCELNPKSEFPLANLGGLYIEEAAQKDDEQSAGLLLDKALDVLEQGVTLNPRSAKSHFLLGQANYRSSFFEEAESAFKKAIELDPNFGPARLMLAEVYAKEARWSEVLDILDAYLKDNPKAPDRTSVEQMRERIAKNVQASTK
jgi:tetratricopeptide (TPR) repeat protein